MLCRTCKTMHDGETAQGWKCAVCGVLNNVPPPPPTHLAWPRPVKPRILSQRELFTVDVECPKCRSAPITVHLHYVKRQTCRRCGTALAAHRSLLYYDFGRAEAQNERFMQNIYGCFAIIVAVFVVLIVISIN
ncbi:hypothetical protein [Streptomyces cinereoruber]|uniref:hypothetical protein n=1 Tax=Streptomyces cinereoruber TaxID=67260 RepID=UPI003C2E03A8